MQSVITHKHTHTHEINKKARHLKN